MLILLAALSAAGGPTASAAAPDRPPVQIWMNNDRRFRDGERVRLQIDAEVDGYLLVLNYETDGNIRVLFPLDPRDDARVRAGRRYEVRDEGGTTAFRAGQEGTGWIYSAISADPWRFDDVVQGDRWDYNRLFIERDSDNPEAELTELVQQLAGAGGFDYDVAGYRVYGVTTTAYAYSDYYSRGPIYVYDDYSYCNGWWGCYGYCCSRWPYGGWSIGFTFGSFYPYRYGYWPYRYGYDPYYPYYDYPYYPYRPFYPSGPLRRGPVLVGRPRSYDVFPRSGTHLASGTRFGSGIRGVTGSTGSTATLPPVNWRPRSVARPTADRGTQITRGPAERRMVSPPARRARSESPSYSVPGARSGDGRGRPSDPSPRARGADARGRPDVSSPRTRSDGARGRPSSSSPRVRSDATPGRSDYSSPRVRSDESRGRPSYSNPETRSDAARGRPDYSSPRARGDEGRGRPSYSTPAPRAAGREVPGYSAPRARGGEPRSRGDYASPGRAEPRAYHPPARAEPRSSNTPPRSQPAYRGGGSGGGGGGGGSRAYGGGGGGGGGGSHRASGGGGGRSRRP